MIGFFIRWAIAIVIFLIGRYIGRREKEQEYELARYEEHDDSETKDDDN